MHDSRKTWSTLVSYHCHSSTGRSGIGFSDWGWCFIEATFRLKWLWNMDTWGKQARQRNFYPSVHLNGLLGVVHLVESSLYLQSQVLTSYVVLLSSIFQGFYFTKTNILIHFLVCFHHYFCQKSLKSAIFAMPLLLSLTAVFSVILLYAFSTKCYSIHSNMF